MKPKPARLLDGAPYTPSHATDIRKLFARVRKQLDAEKPKAATVTPIATKRNAKEK